MFWVQSWKWAQDFCVVVTCKCKNKPFICSRFQQYKCLPKWQLAGRTAKNIGAWMTFTDSLICLIKKCLQFVVPIIKKQDCFYLTSDLKKDREHLGSRPLSVWRCSVAWPPWSRWWSRGSRGAWLIGLCVCTCWQEDIVFLFSFFFFCFNQSAMAYMVCCGPKIRRRKLNNVFLFFKGRATVGWL